MTPGRAPVFSALFPLLLACVAAAAPARDTLYGHFPYDDAPASSLAEAGRYRDTGRKVMMQAPAAEAFRKMVEAAGAEGVHIIPISGFRSAAYQMDLWEKQVKKRGSEKAAAKWVAPPGHSEHHTGWTLDLGDGDNPKTDIEQSFDKTPSFVWLSANAAKFGFELSFPKDNVQGVSYEPWHWRYIGDASAKTLFHPQ